MGAPDLSNEYKKHLEPTRTTSGDITRGKTCNCAKRGKTCNRQAGKTVNLAKRGKTYNRYQARQKARENMQPVPSPAKSAGKHATSVNIGKQPTEIKRGKRSLRRVASCTGFSRFLIGSRKESAFSLIGYHIKEESNVVKVSKQQGNEI